MNEKLLLIQATQVPLSTFCYVLNYNNSYWFMVGMCPLYKGCLQEVDKHERSTRAGRKINFFSR